MQKYRTTPLGNGYSPSELLMGRRLQSTLAIVSDELKPRQANNELLRQKERDYKQRQKLNYDRRHRATNLEKLEPNDNVYVCQSLSVSEERVSCKFLSIP
jgi:hypothetical protein